MCGAQQGVQVCVRCSAGANSEDGRPPLYRPGQALICMVSVTLAPTHCHILPYRSGPALIYMDSVTLVLPLADFGALHALARVGGLEKLAQAQRAYPGWAAVQSSVLDRVSVFITDRCEASQTISRSKPVLIHSHSQRSDHHCAHTIASVGPGICLTCEMIYRYVILCLPPAGLTHPASPSATTPGGAQWGPTSSFSQQPPTPPHPA